MLPMTDNTPLHFRAVCFEININKNSYERFLEQNLSFGSNEGFIASLFWSRYDALYERLISPPTLLYTQLKRKNVLQRSMI